MSDRPYVNFRLGPTELYIELYFMLNFSNAFLLHLFCISTFFPAPLPNLYKASHTQKPLEKPFFARGDPLSFKWRVCEGVGRLSGLFKLVGDITLFHVEFYSFLAWTPSPKWNQGLTSLSPGQEAYF